MQRSAHLFGRWLTRHWTDLDMDNARLTINQSLSQTREGGWFFKSPKNKSSRRTTTLPAALVAALEEHRDRQQRIRDLFGPDYPNFNLVLPLPDGTPWPLDRSTDARLNDELARKAFDFMTCGTRMLPNC